MSAPVQAHYGIYRNPDIGTGTYTIMAQMVAERLGVSIDRIEVVLGDTALPPGPVSGGSMATASLVGMRA